MWWRLTGETEKVFYLEASMSLASLFAAGIARGIPAASVWAFSGDGAFLMNPGMLMVERRMALPNLTHFLVANGCYGATHEIAMADRGETDYAGLARAAGLRNVHSFGALDELKSGIEDVMRSNGESFVVLEVEPAGEILPDRRWTARNASSASAATSSAPTGSASSTIRCKACRDRIDPARAGASRKARGRRIWRCCWRC